MGGHPVKCVLKKFGDVLCALLMSPFRIPDYIPGDTFVQAVMLNFTRVGAFEEPRNFWFCNQESEWYV